MKKVLVYQHQSSYNHGCEALVYTITKQIKEKNPNSNVKVASFFKHEDIQFEFPYVDEFIQNNQWLKRFTVPWFVYQLDKRITKSKKLQEKFMFCKPCYELSKSADICVAIGGDTYCYNKGKEHWPLERKMKKDNKKLMLWGCSIEPNDVPGELAEHLSIFDAITVRDPLSYQALIDNNVNTKIYRCADPAFLLETKVCQLPAGWEEGKMVGLNFSPMVMGNVSNKDETRNAVVKLVQHILETSDNKIVLIPHVRLSFSDDYSELKLIYDRFKETGRVIIVDDISLNARELKYIISKCSVFVGARTHATIAAYSTGVPTLAIGYSIKARGIARDLFGSEEGKVIPVKEIRDIEKFISTYNDIYVNRNKIRKELLEIMPEYSKKALVSGEVFKALLEE